MRTIKDTETVVLSVTTSELLDKRWLNLQLLSKKLGYAEQKRGLSYKSLRNKFYNSRACGKYNMKDIAGLACIDVYEPMKGEASLVIKFDVQEA